MFFGAGFMSSMIEFALCRAVRFTFAGYSSLRRDHLDRRVVAEFEGAARVVLLKSSPSLTIEGDDYVLVTAADGDDVDLVVTNGPSNLQFDISATEFVGCGWVAADDAPATVDGIKIVLSHVPTPFFFGFSSDRACRFRPIDAAAIELNRWRIDDPTLAKTIGFRVKNLSKITALPDGTPVASHLNAMHWRVSVPDGVEALMLQKTYDRFHGRQRARVLVDGAMRGWWYAPDEDRLNRIATTRFAAPVDGGRCVDITIDPPAGAPLWSVSEMVVYGIGSPTRMPRPFVPM